MKVKYIFLLFLLTIVIQSKKCSGNGSSNPTPPSATKKSTQVQLVFDNGGNGVQSNTTPIHFPNMGGSSNFPSHCTFTLSDFAFINITVKYRDVNNIEQVYDVISKTNNDVVSGNGLIWPYLDLDLPETGDYWLELEYSLVTCTNCCAFFNTLNTGVIGCNPNPPFTTNGRPKITAKTFYNSYPGSVSWGAWEEYDFLCICDCQ